MGTAVLAFREPLTQLTEDRARRTVALEPSEHLLSAASAVSNRHLNSFERAIAWA